MMLSLSRQFRLAGITALTIFCLTAPGWSADGNLRAIQYDPATQQFVIDTTGPVKAIVNTLNIAGNKRIIIDLDNAEIGLELPRDSQLLRDLNAQLPGIRNITVNQYAGNGRPIVRILLDMQGDVRSVRLIRNQGPRLALEVGSGVRLPNTPSGPISLSPHSTFPATSPPPAYNPPLASAPARPDASDVDRASHQQALRLLEEQRQQINSLQAQLAQAQSAQDSDISVTQMKGTLLSMNKRYEALMEENRMLSARLAQQRAPEPDRHLQSELDRIRHANANLQNQVNNLLKEANTHTKTQSELASVRQQLNQTHSQLQELRRQQSTQTQTDKLLAARESEIDRLQKLNQTLQRQITDQKSDQSSLEEMKRTLVRMNQQYDSLKADNERLRSQAGGQSGNVPASELQALKKQLSEAQQSLGDSIRTINEQNKELAYLQSQISNLKSNQLGQGSHLQEQLRQRDAQITELEQQLASLRKSGNTSSAAQAELESLRLQVADLNHRLANSSGSSNADKEEIIRLLAENRKLQETLAQAQEDSTGDKPGKSQQRTLEKQIDELKKQLAVAQRKTPAKAEPDPSAQQTIQSLQKHVDELTRQLSATKRELSAVEARMASTGTKSDSSSPEAERNYTEARASQVAGELDQAIDKYKTALLLDQDNGRFAIDYSTALAEKRDYAEAIDVMRRYIQRNPGDRDAFNQLGKLYLLNEQSDAATQAFTRAISVSTLNNYATALKKLEQVDDAENVFKLALKLNPNDSEVLFNLGNLYNSSNRLELARNTYLQAIQVRPDFAEAHYNLGLVFSRLNDNVHAVKHLERFLALSPTARNAETIRAYVAKLKG